MECTDTMRALTPSEENVPTRLPRRVGRAVISLAVAVVFLLSSSYSGASPAEPTVPTKGLPGQSHPDEGDFIVLYDGLWRAAAPLSVKTKVQSLTAFFAFEVAEVPSTYQLTDFEIDIRDDELELLGVWSRVGVSPHLLHIDLSTAAFEAKRTALGGQYQLLDIELYTVGGERRFAAIWRPRTADERVEVDLEWDDLVDVKDTYEAEGYYLVDVEPYFTEDGWHFAALWHPGWHDVHLEYQEDKDDFLQAAQRLAEDEGWRLGDIERRYGSDGERLYLGLWHQGTDPDWLSMALDWTIIETNDLFLTNGIMPPGPGGGGQEPIEARNLIDIEVVSIKKDGMITQAAIHDEPTTGPPDV